MKTFFFKLLLFVVNLFYILLELYSVFLHRFIGNPKSSLCFNCKGQSNISNEEFVRSEQKSIDSTICDDENQSDQSLLFGYSFHKGHSLVYDVPLLFKMAKYVNIYVK